MYLIYCNCSDYGFIELITIQISKKEMQCFTAESNYDTLLWLHPMHFCLKKMGTIFSMIWLGIHKV